MESKWVQISEHRYVDLNGGNTVYRSKATGNWMFCAGCWVGDGGIVIDHDHLPAVLAAIGCGKADDPQPTDPTGDVTAAIAEIRRLREERRKLLLDAKIEVRSKSGNTILAFHRESAQLYVGDVLNTLEDYGDRIDELADARIATNNVARDALQAIGQDGSVMLPVHELAEQAKKLTAERDRLAGEVRELDDCREHLRRLGEVCGCDHVDSPDDRTQQARHIREAIQQLAAERDRLAAAVKRMTNTADLGMEWAERVGMGDELRRNRSRQKEMGDART